MYIIAVQQIAYGFISIMVEEFLKLKLLKLSTYVSSIGVFQKYFFIHLGF